MCTTGSCYTTHHRIVTSAVLCISCSTSNMSLTSPHTDHTKVKHSYSSIFINSVNAGFYKYLKANFVSRFANHFPAGLLGFVRFAHLCTITLNLHKRKTPYNHLCDQERSHLGDRWGHQGCAIHENVCGTAEKGYHGNLITAIRGINKAVNTQIYKSLEWHCVFLASLYIPVRSHALTRLCNASTNGHWHTPTQIWQASFTSLENNIEMIKGNDVTD